LEWFCRRAAMLAIGESIAGQPEPLAAFAPFTIEPRHFETALAEKITSRATAAADEGRDDDG
jgi:hypothetical protein